MGTKIGVKSVEFIEKGWPTDVNNSLKRHSTMIKELQDFVVGVRESIGGIKEEIQKLNDGVREVRENQERIESKIEGFETNLSLTNDTVKSINRDQIEKWKEHQDFHENNKGMLASIFGKWKEK